MARPSYCGRAGLAIEWGFEGATPVQVSERLHARADSALALLADLSANGDDELRHTLADVRTMTLLGKYYAHKIRGATELALFRATGNVQLAILQKAQIARAHGARLVSV